MYGNGGLVVYPAGKEGGERRGEDAGRLRSQRQVMRMRGGVAFEATPPLLLLLGH